MATYGNTQQVGDLLSQWCFELIFLVLTAFHPHFLGNELLALFGQRCHGIRIIFRRDVASHYQSFRSAWDEASLQGLGMVGYGRTLQIPPVNMRKAMEIQIVDFPSLCHQKGRVTIFLEAERSSKWQLQWIDSDVKIYWKLMDICFSILLYMKGGVPEVLMRLWIWTDFV